MAKPYRFTPARRAALRRAQMASARARKGTGRAKSVVRKSGSAASKSARNKKIAKTAIVGTAAVGVIVGSNYVYKNREDLIIKHEAERRAVSAFKKHKKAQGKKATKEEIRAARLNERKLHKERSTLRVREYKEARKFAHSARRAKSAGYATTASLNPKRKGNVWEAMKKQGVHIHPHDQRAHFESYRKDVHSRAVSRLNRRKGTKRRFSYDSGKRLLVNEKGKVKRAFW